MDGRQGDVLAKYLPRANFLRLPREYLAFTWLLSVTGAVGSLILTFLIGLAAGWTWIALLIVPLLAVPVGGALAYGATFAIPYLVASERGSNIDENLGFAIEYMSNLIGPGTSFLDAARLISNPKVHGQLAHEMQRLVRDMTVLGMDRTAALDAAMRRSPSSEFSGVLQGISTSLSTGADLSTYLRQKSRDLGEVAESNRAKSLESLGILAEMFVVSVIAVPLLLLILLVAVAIFDNTGTDIADAGFQLFTILVPLLYAAFIGVAVIYKPTT